MSAPVTHAIDADGIGWLVFDDPAGRANVFTPAVFAALEAAWTALLAAGPQAIVVRSGKDRIFIAGADLAWLARMPDATAAAAVSREGHRIFGLIAASPVPVVAAVHGAAAGGGCELMLACTARIASDAAVTQIGLPEVGLGVIPGWGGTARLPRLLGAAPALAHMLKGALLPAAEAKAAGLVDEVVPADSLLARARSLATELAAGAGPLRATPAPAAAEDFSAPRKLAASRHRGVPAATALVDLVERTAGLTMAEALAAEAAVFGEVASGPVARNMVHAYFLRDGARKRSLAGWYEVAPGSAKPGTIRKVGVVGAGVMGSGIAQWCAARGLEVVLRDVQPEFVERGLGVIHGLFAEGVKRGKMTEAAAAAGRARIATTTAWDGFGECDLVIEAIVENVAAKQRLFTELAAVVRPDTLLASNTSALPIDEIAGHVPDPARTLGIHFFNPVSRMPLVELIVAPRTSAATAQAALDFVKALGKSPVIGRSSPGFLVTRVLFFYLNEACRLWEQGVPTEAIDAALHDWGWPMGPMRLIDEVGVDVTDFIFGEMAHYFPDRFARTSICGRLLGVGLKGRKNGAGTGFYAYADRREQLNPTVAAMAPAAKIMAPDEIARRLMTVMHAEAQRCLDEGVIKSPDDVDFALLSGAGFPAFRGGLMRTMAAAD